MITILYSVWTLIVAIIFFFLGRITMPKSRIDSFNNTSSIDDFLSGFKSKAKNRIEEITHPSIPTGQIKKKTASDLLLGKDPKRKESIEEMRKALDKVPELREQKDLLLKYNKENGIK